MIIESLLLAFVGLVLCLKTIVACKGEFNITEWETSNYQSNMIKPKKQTSLYNQQPGDDGLMICLRGTVDKVHNKAVKTFQQVVCIALE